MEPARPEAPEQPSHVQENTTEGQDTQPLDQPPVEAEAAAVAAGHVEAQQAEPESIFTPRSILRRLSETEDPANKKALRATISTDISFMADALLEPDSGAGEAVTLFERLHLDSVRFAADLKLAQEAKAKAEEAYQQRKCTFDPKTTRKKGKAGKEAAAHPPYRTFSAFLEEQERWLKQRPGRLQKLERQAQDIIEGKRDVRSEMGKTTKSLVARMERDKRYLSPSSTNGWQQRFQDHLLSKAGIEGMIQIKQQQQTVDASSGSVDALLPTRRKDVGDSIYSFSPVISAYAASKAARERGEQSSMSPIRQRWEEDPAAFAAETEAQYSSGSYNPQPLRASGTVFEKLYHDSAVRAAAGRILAESFVENERSSLFHPKTNNVSTSANNNNASWAFSSRGGSYVGGSFGDSFGEEGGGGGMQQESQMDELGSNDFGFGGPRPMDVVVQSLHAKGEEYKVRKELLKRAHEEGKEQHSFKPQTNKHSHRILAEYAKRAEEELTNELVRQTLAALNSADVVDPPDTVPAGVTGIPVPKKAAKFDVEQFTMRHERAAALKQAKLQAIAEQRDGEIFGECTFRPALSSKSLRGFSPPGDKRPHNIFSPGSVASAYSGSVPASVRGTHHASRNSSFSSPLDGRHRPLPSSAPNTSSVASRSLGAFSGSIPSSPKRASQRHTSGPISQTESGASSPGYQIPLASVLPTERHVERPINLSPTNSQRHDHQLLAAEDGDDANEYLDSIENEMQGVLDEWRGVARGVGRN